MGLVIRLCCNSCCVSPISYINTKQLRCVLPMEILFEENPAKHSVELKLAGAKIAEHFMQPVSNCTEKRFRSS